jgi:hypothetical protein
VVGCRIVRLDTWGKECLGVSGASLANGAAIRQYTCGSGANQQFRIG